MTCCTVFVCFPQNAIDFIILSFFCLNNIFFINSAWKFNLQSGCLKVKFCVLYDMSDCLNQQSYLFPTGVDSWILLPARDVCECKSLPSRPTWRWNSSWWCWASSLGLLTRGVCSDQPYGMKNSLQRNFTFYVIPVTSTVSSFSDINLVEWKFYVVCCITELHHVV